MISNSVLVFLVSRSHFQTAMFFISVVQSFWGCDIFSKSRFHTAMGQEGVWYKGLECLVESAAKDQCMASLQESFLPPFHCTYQVLYCLEIGQNDWRQEVGTTAKKTQKCQKDIANDYKMVEGMNRLFSQRKIILKNRAALEGPTEVLLWISWQSCWVDEIWPTGRIMLVLTSILQ